MDIVLGLFDGMGAAITESSNKTSIIIRRVVDGFILDWDDSAFKDADWESLSTSLSEIDSDNMPGYYDTVIDPAAWNDGLYQILFSYSEAPKLNDCLELSVTSGVADPTRITKVLSQASSIVALPVMQAKPYTGISLKKSLVRIVKGDNIRLTFDFGQDCTGWGVSFAAKKSLKSTSYVLGPRVCVWTDSALGHGYVDLTTSDTSTVQYLYAEYKLTLGQNQTTPVQFCIDIVESITNIPELT